MRPFKEWTSAEARKWVLKILVQFPHCHPRQIHAPGVCEYCDGHPEWQALRIIWGIPFDACVLCFGPISKHERRYPCPAEFMRAAETLGLVKADV